MFKILIASAIAAFTAFVTRQLLVDYEIITLHTFLEVLFQLVASGGIGVIFYVLTSYLLKSSELKAIKELFFN